MLLQIIDPVGLTKCAVRPGLARPRLTYCDHGPFICRVYNKYVKVEFDARKRKKTLAERELDFARADEVFAGHHFTRPDLRVDHGEDRYITVGRLDGRMVVVVWTPRGTVCRVISMRKGNDREQARYAQKLD